MANPPDDGPDDPTGDDSSRGENPFKGTPFEQLFGALGGGAGGQGGPGLPGGMPDLSALFGGQMPDLGQMMAQVQALMQPYDGPVNWDVVLDTARKQVASQPDPTPTPGQKDAVADAIRLADLWLDETTELTSGVSTTAAWSRAEWLVETLDVWKHLVEPIAASANGALGKALPAEAAQMAGPLIGMLGKVTGAMVGGQVASGLGALASEVLTASDIGLPLGPVGKAAIVPANVASLADGLDVSGDDVLLYLALREAAHQRLFAGVPWLREHLLGAVRDYGEGLQINTEQIQSTMEERLRGLDPTNPAAMQEMLEGGMFDLEQSPAQKAALSRLEVTLALVEGWVDEVVGQATATRMPAAAKLQEAVRRRRAAGGPAEQTFASLVGLELRPRRLRDASTLWGSLRTRQGVEARDGVWMHPDLLPTDADLDDPLGFREDAAKPDELSEEQFDAELQALLDGTTPASDEKDVDPEDEGPKDEGPKGDGPA
ncbi:zinc-dependent metalloprotease [uncultured Nocardioides sp.]|uniref:zinc-dependent metalloprotease n=1 Tax=uncultured Nocardioides sp. TaxID=198441 RepID=UPI00260A9EED|nr:zinc-dependent metalloprotease [uncultured Nocardioides sp.]